MDRRAAASLLCVAFIAPAAARAEPPKVGYPASIAAIGDSITRAYNTGRRPFADDPSYSWSTGTRTRVRSAYLRILGANPAIRDRRVNVGRDGARMSDFARQAGLAVAQRPDYVTVMLGSNDVCRSSEAAMTPVARFRGQADAGLRTLSAGLPDARIQVVSIPDVYRLWELFRGSIVARTVWRLGRVCQSLLMRPESTAARDRERRERVRRRTRELNEQLAQACAAFIHCRFDGMAVFRTAFGRSDVSSRDYFHPSRAGQTRLAGIVWGATFDFRDATAPVSLALVTPGAGGTIVTVSATDDRGVAGIEFRLNGGAWTRHDEPELIPTGHTFEYRAVDVNGNIEESRVIIG